MNNTAKPKKILYGIQGEGRGHASRSLHIINQLIKQGHDVQVFSGGDALTLLDGTKLSIYKIPIFHFYHGKRDQLSLVKTAYRNFFQFLGLMFCFGQRYNAVLQKVDQMNPDFIITDFEPYLSRIATKKGIPNLAINHQHVFLETKLPLLNSVRKAIRLQLLKLFIKILTGKPDRAIASSFYHFPPRKKSIVKFVGPFISDLVYQHNIATGNHITVYLKEAAYLNYLLPIIGNFKAVRFQIFSYWEHEKKPEIGSHIELFSIDQKKFIASLASSKALITTAGNQVIGEAAFMGKPVLAFPKLGDVEQEINGKALAYSGFGESVHIKNLTTKRLNRFLKRIPFYQQNIKLRIPEAGNYDATATTLEMIEDFVWEFVNNKKAVYEIKLGKMKIQFSPDRSRFGFVLVR